MDNNKGDLSLLIKPKSLKEKEREISKLASNIRMQLVLFEINYFIHSTIALTNHINQITKCCQLLYKTIRYVKFIAIFSYSLMMFFEKPFHCYRRNSFFIYPEKVNNECQPNLAAIHKHFLPLSYYRGIELFFMISFLMIQIILIVQKKLMKSLDATYKIIQMVLFSFLMISIGDISFGLALDFYPLMNFFLRPIIQILLIRNLRMIWFDIFALFYKTRNIFFLLICNIMCFGIVGYFLFSSVSSDFSSVIEAMYSMFILLSTCNFPDVMLGTLTQDSSWSAFFFAGYIVINYIIIFSLLKSMYYSSFFLALVERAREMLKIIRGQSAFNEFTIEGMQLFLCGLSKKYLISFDEAEILFDLLQVKDRKSFRSELKTYLSKEGTIHSKPLGKFFSSKASEAIINVIDFVLLFFLFNVIVFIHPVVTLFQFIWCSLFLVEYGFYVYHLGLKRMIKAQYLRTLFFLINLINWILLLITLIMNALKETPGPSLVKSLQILLILRLIRIILFLKKFKEFKLLFRILHHMKAIYYGLISTLFSFFFVFSTLSIFLTGGKHTENDFDLIKDIPDFYVHINFNDYSSAFVSCFCLTMVNNINIIARSLSFHNNQYFKAYFATFYFFSTLVILNICQTLLLEMYFIINEKKSLSG